MVKSPYVSIVERVRLIIDKDAPLVGSVDTSPLTSDIVDGLTQGLQKKLQQLKERQKQVEVELNKLRNEYEAKVNEVLKGVRRATAAYYYKKNKVEKQLKPDYDNACRPLFQRNEELIYKIELTSKQTNR